MIENSEIFINGNDNNFIVFNPLKIELSNNEIILEEIQLNKSEFWNKIKSLIWSSNCKIGFIINEINIIIINVYDNKAFKSNLSYNIFEEFFNAFKR